MSRFGPAGKAFLYSQGRRGCVRGPSQHNEHSRDADGFAAGSACYFVPYETGETDGKGQGGIHLRRVT